jgi:hypothetical protein
MRRRWPATARLHSGSVRGSWRGTANYGELGATVDVDIPASDPVMRAFAASGRLGRAGEEWRVRSRAERQAISRFFARCR